MTTVAWQLGHLAWHQRCGSSGTALMHGGWREPLRRSGSGLMHGAALMRGGASVLIHGNNGGGRQASGAMSTAVAYLTWQLNMEGHDSVRTEGSGGDDALMRCGGGTLMHSGYGALMHSGGMLMRSGGGALTHSGGYSALMCSL